MKPERIWIARLLRKDNHDELDSVLVSATDKFDAIAKANHEFRARDANTWHYGYVWVEEKQS